VAGVLFSIMACSGALGHHVCGKLLQRFPTRLVIVGGAVVAGSGSVLVAAHQVWQLCVAAVLLGLGIGAAMTASYTAAGSVIPARAHGTGFGVLTSASLIGMASSPFIAGLLGGTSIRAVFVLNAAVMAVVAAMVHRKMVA
jgi:MFS family permease